MRVPGALAVAVVASIPVWAPTRYVLHMVILACMFTVLALSYDIVVGHVGMLSLAPSAFFGIGAYTVAILDNRYELTLSFPLIALAGIGVAGLIALLVGIPALRITGNVFAMATLAFAYVTEAVARNWVPVTRGPMCIPGVAHAQFTVFGQGVALGSVAAYYYVILALAVVVILLYARVSGSRAGRTFNAIRHSPALAETFGVRVNAYRLSAFVISAAGAGLAGVFYAHYTRVVCPEDLSFVYITVTLLAIIFIGGARSLGGILAAAVLVTSLPELLRFTPSARLALYGLLLLAVVLFFEGGLAAAAQRWTARARRRRGAGAHDRDREAV